MENFYHVTIDPKENHPVDAEHTIDGGIVRTL